MSSHVYTFFSDLKFRLDIVKQHSAETNRFLSRDFNVFDYIYADENKLSDIIADLLDPIGKHGQADLFLKEFIKLIRRSEFLQKSHPKVSREIRTTLIPKNRRKMDILIEWPTHGVMIESKPWAKDQHEQLWDYKQYLERRFKQNFLIVYLSKRTEKPKEHSISSENLDLLIENKQFIQISFEIHLKEWLRNSFRECESEKMRWFLKDFISYLDNNFN